MNKSVTRIGLAAIAAFYVVIGGLFLQAYIPVKMFDAQLDRKVDAAYGSKESEEAEAYLSNHVLSYDGNEAKAHRYGTILLWGTIALGAGGGVLLLTRGRKSQPAQTGAQ